MSLINNIIEKVVSNFISDRLKPVKSPDEINIHVSSIIEHKKDLIESNNLRSLRLKQCLNILNGKNSDTYTPEFIAMEMEADSIQIIENYFSGIIDPPTNWLKAFAVRYHINIKWLLTGKEAMFSHHLIRFASNPESIISKLKSETINNILFIKDDSDESVCCIVAIHNDQSFDVIHKYCNWRISDETGGTGQSDTFSYYQIVQTLLRDRNTQPKTFGYIIPKTLLNQLISGEIHPVNQLNYQCCLWYEYLSDFEHKKHNQDFYDRFYGTSFVKAQKVIMSHIN